MTPPEIYILMLHLTALRSQPGSDSLQDVLLQPGYRALRPGGSPSAADPFALPIACGRERYSCQLRLYHDSIQFNIIIMGFVQVSISKVWVGLVFLCLSEKKKTKGSKRKEDRWKS